MGSGKNAHQRLAKQLHASVDGRGLRHHGQTPHVNPWLTNGTALLSGCDYSNNIKVRGNLLLSAERTCSSRGRRQSPVICDAGCNSQSTLAHVSQSCVRTHRLRCDRHDSILSLIVDRIDANGGDVIRERNIPTDQGVRKPDIVALVKETAYVVDVTITADCGDMSGPFQDKVS